MEKQTLKCAVLGGFGGMLPILTRLGASLVSDAPVSAPAASLYVGMLVYFVIGFIVSLAFEEKTPRQALFAGLAAPAIIASGVSGSQPAQHDQGATNNEKIQAACGFNFWESIFTSSWAESPANSTIQPNENKAVNVIDFQPILSSNKFVYTVSAIPNGATDWRRDGVDWEFILVDTKGANHPIKIAGAGRQSIALDRPADKMLFRAGKFASESDIPKSNSGGDIILAPTISTQKDFWWAMGGKGRPVVKNIKMELIPNPLEKPNVSPNRQIIPQP